MKFCYTASMIHSWYPLQCDVDNFILKGFCVWDGWSIRAIVILNVQSYAGGKNLWGWPGFATLAKVVQCWINQSVLFSVLCQIWMHFICDCHYISLYAFTLVLVFLMSSSPWNLLHIRLTHHLCTGPCFGQLRKAFVWLVVGLSSAYPSCCLISAF